MAKRKKSAGALEGTAALNEVQAIVRRLVEDEDLRESLGRAIEASRHVYERVSSAKKPSKLIEDKKLQSEAIEAFDAIRSVTIALTGVGKSLPSPKALASRRKKRRGGLGKVVLIAGAGGTVAIIASDNLRSKLLDALFGAEEEFQYTPPPPPPTATDAPGSPLSAV